MPRVSVTINAPDLELEDNIVTLDLPPGLTVKDLKVALHGEAGLAPQHQHFFFNGQPLADEHRTLEEVGITDGEMLAVIIQDRQRTQQSGAQRRPGQANQGASAFGQPQNFEIEGIRLQILGNPQLQEDLQKRNPALLAALNDADRWREQFIMARRNEVEAERKREREIEELNADPMNPEAQARIEELIRQENVINNLQYAYEHNPEVFVRVHMLYINVEVNGHPVKAFVDSGAQATIMSPSCAEACGIMRLIDTRYSGIAKGVGTAKILGRVHHAEIKIGGAVMPCAFTVMEGKDVDLLFGLDMLKRYKAKIDLEKNALCFEGIEVPFLPENEIPTFKEDDEASEPTVSGPNGTEIGGRTGAVRPAGTTASGGSRTAVGPPPPQPRTGAPGPSSAAPTRRPAQWNPDQPFAHELISQLEGLGFSRESAIEALRATNGNVEFAASILFARQE